MAEIDRLWELIEGRVHDMIQRDRTLYRDDGTDVGRAAIVDFAGSVSKSGNVLTVTNTAAAAHDLAGASHNADTLADLNTKLSDATLFGKELFDAQTVLAATNDNDPAALAVAEQRLVGRLTGGNVAAITIGISDNNIPQVDGPGAGAPANGEYAKWTANGLEGKSTAELLSDIGAQATSAKNGANGYAGLDANGRLDPTQTGEKRVSITVEDPSASEDIGITRFNVAVTITKIIGVLVGYTSVTINPKHHTDRSNAGNAVLSGATAITSTTTGDNVNLAGGDVTIPADSFLWLETTAKTGTTGQLELTIFYTEN